MNNLQKKNLIMIVEDDHSVANLIRTTLRMSEYEYVLANNGAEAIQLTASRNPTVILLDLGLPDIDGIEVIKKIRSWSVVPIIVISARSEESDKIEALDAGADDYLTKPFSIDELLARLRVTFRRITYMENRKDNAVFENGNLRIDFSANSVSLAGKEIHLTPNEYRVLSLLAQNVGKVITYTAMAKAIWGNALENDTASLRVYVTSLRRKMESLDCPGCIKTHVGIGYQMIRL